MKREEEKTRSRLFYLTQLDPPKIRVTDFGFHSEMLEIGESRFLTRQTPSVAWSGNTVIPTFTSEIRDLSILNEKLV
jgi:hypothetical protein